MFVIRACLRATTKTCRPIRMSQDKVVKGYEIPVWMKLEGVYVPAWNKSLRQWERLGIYNTEYSRKSLSLPGVVAVMPVVDVKVHIARHCGGFLKTSQGIKLTPGSNVSKTRITSLRIQSRYNSLEAISLWNSMCLSSQQLEVRKAS